MRFVAILIIALVLVSPAMAQDVWIKSLTPSVPAKVVRHALPGLQRGVQDFQSWWGGEPATLRYGKSPDGSYQVSISPTESVWYSGYHGVGPHGPYVRVFGANEWTITLTHEVFEMLADPNLNRTAQGDKLYLVEVCDPVENYSYKRLGVPISDFVGPEWYTGGSYFDYLHVVTAPHQLTMGGYVSYWNGYDWAQIDG